MSGLQAEGALGSHASVTFAPLLRMDAATSSPAATFRLVMMTRAPMLANTRAVSAPACKSW